MQIRMLVRSPAGLPPSSRSKPIAPPSNVARPSCSMRSSRKISIRRCHISLMEESHLVAHFDHGLLRARARAPCAFAQPCVHSRRIAPQGSGALPHRRECRDHAVGELALAVDAPPSGGATLDGYLLDHLGRREPLVQRMDVTDIGSLGVFTRDPVWT